MEDVATIANLNDVFKNVVSAILFLAGFILFIMLVSGGFKYITSGGDPKAVEEAKKTLTYAIGGVVLIALSYLVIVFIQDFTGATVTEFNIIGN